MPDHEFLPPSADTALPHAGTYRRVLPVSLERLYENALDWEHLPHLHGSSFAAVRCLDAGASGWRATLRTSGGESKEMILELTLDRVRRRWITRTVQGFGAGTEIWTHAAVQEPRRVEVVVDFFVPGLDPAARTRAGEAYARHYARLYDEDVAMMTERQRQLDRRLDRARDEDRTVTLGPRSALALPVDVVVGGREFVVAEVDDVLVAFPRQCPHQLGPLSAGTLSGRVVTCPWHGDQFDVVTGENLSGRACSLSHCPAVVVDEAGLVRVSAVH